MQAGNWRASTEESMTGAGAATATEAKRRVTAPRNCILKGCFEFLCWVVCGRGWVVGCVTVGLCFDVRVVVDDLT